MLKLSINEAYELKRIFSHYLRIRADHIEDSQGFLPMDLSTGQQKAALVQLAADVDHSDLLVRLLQSEHPLTYDEWKETYRDV